MCALTRTGAERPPFAITGREDEVYHEGGLTSLHDRDPDFFAFLNQSWTFNRSMCWVNAGDGNLICYEGIGNLPLTGEDRVSEWFSDPANTLTHDGRVLTFHKKSGRQREVTALPALQFNIEQHPAVRLQVLSADSEWQFCALVKGRSGAPIVCSGWQTGPGVHEFDVADLAARRGYKLRFLEMHFAVGVWTTDGSEASIAFSLNMPGHAAVVPCLPVVRTEASRVTISAVVVDDNGELICGSDCRLTATLRGTSIPMTVKEGTWTADFGTVPEGDYDAKVESSGTVGACSSLRLRVNKGVFLSYDSGIRSLTRAGKPLGPLNGSYQGLFAFKDVGAPGEAIINGQSQWEELDRSEQDKWHYWEALTEDEVETRLAYLEKCGWDILHLCQGWKIWEKLDAGGHIAPHGAEQLAMIHRIAARHGLAVLQALSHYPYGSDGTRVLRQYLEAGFEDSNWSKPGGRFDELFHSYLKDYITLFSQDDAVFAMTTSGEGDVVAGRARVNDTYRFVKQNDPNHLFVSEAINRMEALPDRACEGWEPQLAGGRSYWIGETIEPDADIAIEYKLLGLGDFFMAEGCWPCQTCYAKFVGFGETWMGADSYRMRVRDHFYMGLVHRCPLILTWDECLTEDEHTILRLVRDSIDWSITWKDAAVAIRVDDASVRSDVFGKRHVLADCERYLSSLPLSSCYVPPGCVAPEHSSVVVDATSDRPCPFPPRKMIEELSPLSLSPGYRASYLWSEDGNTLVAYIYNVAGYAVMQYPHGLSGKIHRSPALTDLRLAVRNLPSDALTCRLFDLSAKQMIYERRLTKTQQIDIEATLSDYLLFVS